MAGLKEYFATGGACGDVDTAALEALVNRCEWFTAARRLLAERRGESDGRCSVTDASRSAGAATLSAEDISLLREWEAPTSSDDIIDRFLGLSEYRIAADEGSEDEEVTLEATFDDDDDMVSEELAEVYLAQGMKAEALAIYHQLSLRNTEKSIYFAEIIDKIEKNN